MANKDRIIASLTNAELCDDCLSVTSGVAPRQTVYTLCRSLSESSFIKRNYGKCDHCHKTKITNGLLDTHNVLSTDVQEKFESNNTFPKPWYWEGNVQSSLVNYLVLNHYTIRSVADTAIRNPGKDIIAYSNDGKLLWVSVKGYPEKSQNVQARHWFSGAIFDLLLYHGEDPNVRLGIALPDGFVTYKNLLPRIRWLQDIMTFRIYWINEDGSVREE